MAKHILATPNEKTLSGRLVMFRNFFNVNLHGEDELITDGAYLHTKGLTGRNATEFTDALKSILNGVKEKRASKDVDMVGEEKTCAASDPSFQIRWIDDDSAFAIFPQHSADLVASVCQEMKACLLMRVGRWSWARGELRMLRVVRAAWHFHFSWRVVVELKTLASCVGRSGCGWPGGWVDLHGRRGVVSCRGSEDGFG